MCDYPKAPENKINQISDNIDLVYDFANKKYNHNEITLIGDSVGGTLIIALIQRLIIRGCQLPNRLILISPVLNASFDNPLIDKIEKKDPILSKKGVLSAKKMCVGNDSLVNPNISPINGNFISFPMTQLYIAENDITYPDQLLLIEKLRDSRVPHSIFFGKGMPHIWPLLPLMKESKIALTDIINSLK